MSDVYFCPNCMTENGKPSVTCINCGMSMDYENKAHHLPVNTILNGRYLVGAVLGEGGFGITYVAYDLKLSLKVALKEYFPSQLVKRFGELEVCAIDNHVKKYFEAGVQNFLEEARTLAKFIDDSNVVRVRDHFSENSTAYIVMEYLNGRSLDTRLKEDGVFAFEQLMNSLNPAIRSLGRIHETGLVHRDISPANLMTTLHGEIKIIDFGIAWGKDNPGEDGFLLYKPGFSPPEQYRTEGKVGPWSDVYSLSATIYKLITGRTPPAANERELNDQLAPPSSLGVKISPDSEKILMKGLELDIDKRIGSVDEILASLFPDNASDNEPQSVGTLSSKSIKQHRQKKAILYILLTVITAVGVVLCLNRYSEHNTVQKINYGSTEQERLEQEHLEQEHLEQEHLEQERLEQEYLEQERESKEKIAEVENSISLIGSVDLNSVSNLELVQKKFDALSEQQQRQVINKSALDAAWETYNQQKREIDDYNAKLEKLGDVDEHSGNILSELKEQYESLGSNKAFVVGYERLLDFEREYLMYSEKNMFEAINVEIDRENAEEYLEALDAFVDEFPDSEHIGQVREMAATAYLYAGKNNRDAKNYEEAIRQFKICSDKYYGCKASEEAQAQAESMINYFKGREPQSGAKLYDETSGSGKGGIRVRAADQSIALKIERFGEPEKCKIAFIRANTAASITVHDGNYTIKYATGDIWYDLDNLFGEQTEVIQIKDLFTFATEMDSSYLYYSTNQYEITLDENSRPDFEYIEMKGKDAWS